MCVRVRACENDDVINENSNIQIVMKSSEDLNAMVNYITDIDSSFLVHC